MYLSKVLVSRSLKITISNYRITVVEFDIDTDGYQYPHFHKGLMFSENSSLILQ